MCLIEIQVRSQHVQAARPSDFFPCSPLLFCEWRFALGSLKKEKKANPYQGYKKRHMLFTNRN